MIQNMLINPAAFAEGTGQAPPVPIYGDNKMKKLTLILPDSIDVLEITCFWRAKNGRLIKSMMVIDGRSHEDGDEINCYMPLADEEEEGG